MKLRNKWLHSFMSEKMKLWFFQSGYFAIILTSVQEGMIHGWVPLRGHIDTRAILVYTCIILDIHAALTNWYYWILTIEYMIFIEYLFIYLLNISYDWLSPPTRLASPCTACLLLEASDLCVDLISDFLGAADLFHLHLPRQVLPGAREAQPASTDAQLTTALA